MKSAIQPPYYQPTQTSDAGEFKIMSAVAEKQTHEFQAEVSQLLKLMVHSLYSNKEIFLRELISNASDACDKLRFEALNNDSLLKDDPELKIHIRYDKDARTLTIIDNGIGMGYDEVKENIGTIARSGTREFLKSLSGDQAKDSQLIGQFGVGFYSSFIVADRVILITRRAGLPEDQAVQWESVGDGNYSIEKTSRPERGTEIILHLREGEEEFADNWRLRSIIKKYSDHINLPIMMPKEKPVAKESEADDAKIIDIDEEEKINSAAAFWMRAKKDLKDEDYKEFYKTIAHDFQEPLAWTHNRVEGKQEYTSLFYIPAHAPFDLWDREHTHGIKLYVQRIFIMDDSEKLMPRYLRFVRGLVDSNDLPLNVSREILQSNKIIDTIRSASVKKILSLLETTAENEPEQYKTVWENFGNVLKEGPAEDFSNKEQIAALMRFASTHTDSAEQSSSLKEYISRMPESQDKIYYLTADSYAAAKNSPHLEVFKKLGIEVLLMCDRVDEWMMQYLQSFDGKTFVSVAKDDIDLDKLTGEENKDEKKDEVQESTLKELAERLKNALHEKVEDVKISRRLTDSPACIVLGKHEMALYMQRLMKQAGHEVPVSKPVLEINPAHRLLEKIRTVSDEQNFGEWAELLFDQAVLAEGGQLENPAGFVKKINALLLN